MVLNCSLTISETPFSTTMENATTNAFLWELLAILNQPTLLFILYFVFFYAIFCCIETELSIFNQNFCLKSRILGNQMCAGSIWNYDQIQTMQLVTDYPAWQYPIKQIEIEVATNDSRDSKFGWLKLTN